MGDHRVNHLVGHLVDYLVDVHAIWYTQGRPINIDAPYIWALPK